MTVNVTYREANPVVPTVTTIKNSPLSNQEIDGNFKGIKDAIDPLGTSAGAGLVGFAPTGGVSATTVQAAIAELDTEKASSTNLAATGGSGLIGYDDGTVKDALDKSKPIADYVALRAYTGNATQIRITNDGIAGFFYYDASDTTSVDNGGTIIVSSNGKRWKRLYDGAVNVKWFGAKGNWNGSTGADDTTAIQLAINSGASTVYYPDGTYLISSALILGSFQTQLGNGKNTTLTSSGTIFTHTTVQQFIVLDSLNFAGSGKAFYQPNNNIYTVNLEVRNCFFGRTLQECIYATLLICNIHDNHFGTNNGTAHIAHRHIWSRGDSTGVTAVNLNTFKNNRFNSSTADSAIYIEYGSGNSFLFNDIEDNNNTIAAVRINGGGLSSFTGNWVESNRSPNQFSFEDAGASLYTIYRNRVINFNDNNIFLLAAQNANGYVFKLETYSLNLSLQGNSFYTNQTGVKLTTTPLGNNAGVIFNLNNSIYGNTVDVTGTFGISTDLKGKFGSGHFGSGTSASTAALITRDNTQSFRAEDTTGTVFFSIGSGGQLITGVGPNSPYNFTTASAANMVVLSNGVVQRSTSSIKYKNNVVDATHGLVDVMKLRPVTYKGNTDGERTFGGFIAEEVEEAGLSEFVVYDDNGSPDALMYANMVSLLTKAIQELKREFDEYKAAHP